MSRIGRPPVPFWDRVDKDTPSGCWLWTGGVSNTGYGTVHYQGRVVTAHRLAAFLSGLVESPDAPKDRKGSGFVLHQCDNRRCCNPAHMKIGTYADNQLEAYKRGQRQQPRGGEHTNSKLTAEQARSIRNEYAAGGVSQDALAAHYGVSQRAISLITLNRTYTEV